MLHASPCFDKLSMTKLKLVPRPPCFDKLSMTKIEACTLTPCFEKLSMTKIEACALTPCFDKLSMTMEARRPELVEGRPLPGQPGLRPRTRRVRDRRACGWTRTKKPAKAMAVSALPKAAV